MTESHHERIIRPAFVRQDDRGTLRELLNGSAWYSVVQGEMVAGAVMGNHYHKETDVFYFLFSGRARIVIRHIDSEKRDEFVIGAMEGVIFKTFETHTVTFEESGAYLLLRSRPYDPKNTDTFDFPVDS